MTYKTVMVHLDTSTGAHTRLSFALKLARKFDAFLDGVFTCSIRIQWASTP